MIGGFPSVLCVSVIQGSLLVIVIVIDGSERWLLNFRVRVFWKSAVTKRSKERQGPTLGTVILY